MSVDNNEVKEIFLYGLARSGNHGLINYLLGHIMDRIPQKKYKQILTGKNKNGTRCQKILHKEKIHLNLASGWYRGTTKSPPPTPVHVPFQILSHENLPDLKLDRDKLLYHTGRKLENKKCIILLRDPYNMLSSVITYHKKHGKRKSFIEGRVRVLKRVWKEYAEEFFLRDELPSWVMPVSFNEWFSDKDYRKKISNFIEEPHTDMGLNMVSSLGSSFNRYKYNNKGQEMKVLERYKKLDNYYKKILNEDQELGRISEKLFGFKGE